MRVAVKLMIAALLLSLVAVVFGYYAYTKTYRREFFLEKLYVPSENSVAPFGIQQTPDGYILTDTLVSPSNKTPSSRCYNFLVVKLNSAGSVEWAEVLGGDDNDGAFSIQQTSDGGYILARSTSSFGFGGFDALVVKLNSAGGVEWAEAIGGSGPEEAFSIQQTSDGGYILAGITNSFKKDSQDTVGVLIAKLPQNPSLSKISCFAFKAIRLNRTSVKLHPIRGNLKNSRVTLHFMKIKLGVRIPSMRCETICRWCAAP